jgi:hypothetical protein
MRPWSRRVVAATIGLGQVLVLSTPAPTAAFPLDACQLTITSRDADGSILDVAESGALDGSQVNPLLVSWSGTVTWTGGTGAVIRHTTWHVEAFGLPTPVRGGDANEDGDTAGEDSVRVADLVPFRVAGLVYVSGTLEGEGGSCRGSGWLQVVGDPTGTIPFIAAVALWLVGAVLLAVGARGHWLPAIGGGLLVGLSSALLLVQLATLPFAEATPGVVAVGGLLLGLLAVVYGRAIGARRAARPAS